MEVMNQAPFMEKRLVEYGEKDDLEEEAESDVEAEDDGDEEKFVVKPEAMEWIYDFFNKVINEGGDDAEESEEQAGEEEYTEE